jgi:HEAT repeat protein
MKLSYSRAVRGRFALVCCFSLASVFAAAQTAPGELTGHKLPPPGEPVKGTTARMSEVEYDIVNGLDTQKQAEMLLQFAISHHRGATDEIKRRAPEWVGKIKSTESMNTLLEVALNGDDLRVRAACIEIELATLNIPKSNAEAEKLIQAVTNDSSKELLAISELGMLANRGVEPDRIHNELKAWMRAQDDRVREAAVSAISFIGTDDTVPDLLEAFHHDASSFVQIQGGGCGLAHCGMLTRAQRMLAVPGLIEMVEDKQLSAEMRPYGYRALREITDQTIGDDPAQWREWYAAHGAETTERFRRFQLESEAQP